MGCVVGGIMLIDIVLVITALMGFTALLVCWGILILVGKIVYEEYFK